jgi:signal transduction histidine kinase
MLVTSLDITEFIQVELAHQQIEEQLRAHQTQLRALTTEVILVQERERRRIAMGLHDQLGQLLSVAQLRLGTLLTLAPSDTSVQLVGTIRDLLDQAIRASRSLIFELSSPLLDQLGLEAAIEALGERMEAEHGIRLYVHTSEQPVLLADQTRSLLFRVLRELLFNIVKHAQARHAHVWIDTDEKHLHCIVRDDGVGFDPIEAGKSISPAGGFGLFSIREQLALVGGCMKITSSPNDGTLVVVIVPLGSSSLEHRNKDWKGLLPSLPSKSYYRYLNKLVYIDVK